MTRIVGVIPAAGLASRMPRLPCSKEIFPVGFQADGSGRIVPKPIGMYVLEQMLVAEVSRILFIVRRGKWDIPQYFGGGEEYGVPIAYLVQERLQGLPYALNLAQPWLQGELVLFGMPDTIILPEDAARRMMAGHRAMDADVTLGAFPTKTPERFGMVAFDDQEKLTYTVDKPAQTDLHYMWGMACWGERFSTYMANYLTSAVDHDREVVLSTVLQAAVNDGLDVRVVPFTEGIYTDVGTPQDLADAVLHEGAGSMVDSLVGKSHFA